MRAFQAGFGLVEVMLALLVIAVALLGQARLQATSISLVHNSYLHSQASMLAQDMFERIRSNPDANYVIGIGSGLPSGTYTCEGTGKNCDTARLSRYDLVHWKCSLGAYAAETTCIDEEIESLLPSGDGSIAVAGDDVTITIQWFDPATDTNQNFVFNATI